MLRRNLMFRNILLVMLCGLFLAACNQEQEGDSSKASSDVLDKGLAAVAAKDLGKAEGIFETATDNEVAQTYYSQVVLLREGQELLKNGATADGVEKLEAAVNVANGSVLIAEMAKESLAAATKTEEEQKTTTEEAKAEPSSVNKAEVIADQASGMSYVHLANEKGNIREQPSIDSKLVHSGEQGDVFVYLQEKVNTSDGRTWYKVEYSSGLVGYISRAVSTLTNEIPSYVRLIENGTNIRSEPSINAPVLYKGEINDTFYYSYDKTYTQDGRTWLHVWLPNGQYGYVSQKVATMTTTYAPTVHGDYYGSTIVISAKEANVRAYPSINSPILVENLKKGEQLIYTGYYYDTSDGRTWYEVEIGNTYGYISKAVGTIQ